ncbi:MAG: caspase family protein [Nostocaceae cyanobacterium]|nr:caspase family protein [Nostocaceae cyanobacterium]
MANNWAIAIGINQYQFFQPLGCAQADAQALRDYLVTGGFSPQKSVLMTDNSPPFGDLSTYPDKKNILLLLEDLAAACWQPGDKLWFFFSGYGVNYDGKDYLMPTEGDPRRVQETGIEIRSLLQTLQIAALDALVLLDINRVSGYQGNNPVGQETVELAQELQIPTILSCQPEQFSHESRDLGYGFFTAAVLEALRSGNSNNLAALERYLSVRTPELCHHYWRPTQNPVTIISLGEAASLEPLQLNINTKETAIQSTDDILNALQAAPKLPENYYKNYTNYQYQFSNNAETNLLLPSPQTPAPIAKDLPESDATKTAVGKQILFWGVGSMLACGLIGILLLRNQPGFKFSGILSNSGNRTIDDKEDNTLNIDSPTEPSISIQPPSLITPPTVSQPPASESQKRNQALLDLAKMSLKATQASDLSKAIATARKIQPGEPLYEKAQENIQIWSNMILDLASGRAKRRQYADAIAAAQLITKDGPLYPKAQKSIERWQIEAKQYLSNKTLLDAASALIESRQASSYNRAIDVARKVTPGEPGFESAQKSIDTWSEKILAIAKNRASRGQYKAAIAAATLVPEDTSAYSKAQAAIQKWQKR